MSYFRICVCVWVRKRLVCVSVFSEVYAFVSAHASSLIFIFSLIFVSFVSLALFVQGFWRPRCKLWSEMKREFWTELLSFLGAFAPVSAGILAGFSTGEALQAAGNRASWQTCRQMFSGHFVTSVKLCIKVCDTHSASSHASPGNTESRLCMFFFLCGRILWIRNLTRSIFRFIVLEFYK